MNMLVLYTLNRKVFTNNLQNQFLLVYRGWWCGKKYHILITIHNLPQFLLILRVFCKTLSSTAKLIFLLNFFQYKVTKYKGKQNDRLLLTISLQRQIVKALLNLKPWYRTHTCVLFCLLQSYGFSLVTVLLLSNPAEV